MISLLRFSWVALNFRSPLQCVLKRKKNSVLMIFFYLLQSEKLSTKFLWLCHRYISMAYWRMNSIKYLESFVHRISRLYQFAYVRIVWKILNWFRRIFMIQLLIVSFTINRLFDGAVAVMDNNIHTLHKYKLLKVPMLKYDICEFLVSCCKWCALFFLFILANCIKFIQT